MSQIYLADWWLIAPHEFPNFERPPDPVAVFNVDMVVATEIEIEIEIEIEAALIIDEKLAAKMTLSREHFSGWDRFAKIRYRSWLVSRAHVDSSITYRYGNHNNDREYRLSNSEFSQS